MFRVQGREKKNCRAAESAQMRCSRHSELSGEPHGGRRGGWEQRHFSGNLFFFYLNVFCKNEFTIHTQEQTASAAQLRSITIIHIRNQMRKTDAAPKLATRNRVLHLGHTDIRFSAFRAADGRTEDNAAS